MNASRPYPSGRLGSAGTLRSHAYPVAKIRSRGTFEVADRSVQPVATAKPRTRTITGASTARPGYPRPGLRAPARMEDSSPYGAILVEPPTLTVSLCASYWGGDPLPLNNEAHRDTVSVGGSFLSGKGSPPQNAQRVDRPTF